MRHEPKYPIVEFAKRGNLTGKPIAEAKPGADAVYVPPPVVSEEGEYFKADSRAGMVAKNVIGVGEEGKIGKGAEPWQWRPFRKMPDGSWGQPDTPVRVPSSPPQIKADRSPKRGSHRAAAMADDEIRTLAKKLGDLYREPVLMRLMGKSDTEIAQRFGLTVRTARERVSKGKGMLRKMWQRAVRVLERETR